MTNFRKLCAELKAALQHRNILTHAEMELIARARAALSQEGADTEPDVDYILKLAKIIRDVDGNHDKGAAALAEAILSHPDSRWTPALPLPQLEIEA